MLYPAELRGLEPYGQTTGQNKNSNSAPKERPQAGTNSSTVVLVPHSRAFDPMLIGSVEAGRQERSSSHRSKLSAGKLGTLMALTFRI